jgi:hypothetical protein
MKTPVLLIGFNRPDMLAGLIDAIRPVAPTHVYVAIDGPRPDRPHDQDLVKRTREVVNEIDWECSVHRLEREENLGCKLGVSSAIDWFFGNVDEGIILEDDLRPDPTFFPFCEQLLERYRNDQRIFAISGCNYVPDSFIGSDQRYASYRFSSVPHVWGWATWRDRWSDYRVDISDWRKPKHIGRLWRWTRRNPASFAFWAGHFELVSRGIIDTWDVQLVFAALRRPGLTVTSNVNLVENVGFGGEATHTQRELEYIEAVAPMEFPLVHPPVGHDVTSDEWTREHHFHATPGGLARSAKRFIEASRRMH